MKIPYLALRIQLVSPPPAVALPCQKKWHVTATKTENTLAARLKKPKLELGFLLGFILLRISGSLVGGLEHCHLFFGLFSPEPGHPDGLSGFMRVLRRIGIGGLALMRAGSWLAHSVPRGAAILLPWPSWPGLLASTGRNQSPSRVRFWGRRANREYRRRPGCCRC